MEAVIGVILYSKVDFIDAGGDWPNTPPMRDDGVTPYASIEEWMGENGQVMLFSRFSGKVIRERNDD